MLSRLCSITHRIHTARRITLRESIGAVTEATGMAQTRIYNGDKIVSVNHRQGMVQLPARQSQWRCLRSRHGGTASSRTRTATTRWRTSGRWACSLQGCRVARSIVEAINRRALFRCKHLFIQGDIRAARFSDANPFVPYFPNFVARPRLSESMRQWQTHCQSNMIFCKLFACAWVGA
jgi:hypothetical protein